MKIYQVGGSIRDKILAIEPNDVDYCVVGSTVEEMLSLGYKQVGKDFPVFLHPSTAEEYALARTERKTGDKHTDFKFDFNSDITIEEDLARRDFTCNAIAQNVETGEIVDPFNGRSDIKNKMLRIVRPNTFIEDPLRVIRLARFAAQLNFKISEETMNICKDMVKSGMIKHLTAERIWKEFEKALHTNNFANFIEVMNVTNAMDVIIPEISAEKAISEIEEQHPEKNTYAHTMLTLKYADENSMSPMVKFGLVFHDIGKILTPESIKPHHYGHEEAGLNLIKVICYRLRVPNAYLNFALKACKYHMVLRKMHIMKAGKIYDVVEDITSGFKDIQMMKALFDVSKADLFGRGKKPSDDQINQFNTSYEIANNMYTVMSHITANNFPEMFVKNINGKKFGEVLRSKKIQYYIERIKK